MGANSPRPPVSSQETKPGGFSPFFIAVIAFLIMCALEWSDVIEYIDGEPRLTAKHQNQLQKKLNELEEAEQYALIASKEGYYPCLHSGHALYFLHIGEVWKYGVTTKGERGRYTGQFMLKNSVSYSVQYKGTLSECLQREQIQLFSYPLLPENLARPENDRLLRPPYNPVFK
ncbi:MAG: hypothetical protein LCH81_09240 [Bacteroidetes bacterium]|nr:hypothetical protein [Bacteroidota bacterium]